ncbi:nicotinate-nucleotide--dimethylbenzimidazole phosphoribosyltransferase [Marinospirillum sp. MEB164]|uniref:Nicotinate-nucleotide--dimethylbenzimidazole phosphoribosyltransferase n=1 Tax=Marinospirillum alkalitolerans TaxID=3123374 RepID=A0ABW8PYU9_9GAMM
MSCSTPSSTYTPPPLARPVSPAARAHYQARLDEKTKPLGALGGLETLALRLACLIGGEQPELQDPQVMVFAADHGLAAEGISAFPQSVTHQMLLNFLSGGAAINVFARQHQLALTLVDAGVIGDLPAHPQLRHYKLGQGTQSSLHQAAMTEADCITAIKTGQQLVSAMPGNLLILGEMGIGNTSAASLIISRLLGLPITEVTGRGTGLDDPGLARKQQVLTQVLARHPQVSDPLGVLATFGGFEIAMMTGALLQAASEGRVLLMDGVIASSALLVAEQLQPGIKDWAIFSHRSAEPGHALLLEALGAEPLLDLGLRLGEGTGAALAYPLLVSALAMLNQMASLTEAGVSGPAGKIECTS